MAKITDKGRGSTGLIIAWELLMIVAATAMVAAYCYYTQVKTDRFLSNCILTVLSFMIAGFQIRNDFSKDSMDYDNGEHPLRFFACFFLSLLLSGLCLFLPVSGWPFVFIFVILTLFSNVRTGTLVSLLLLTLTVMLTGGEISGFLIYGISGIFAVSLFRQLDDKFHMVSAFLLSMSCLLVCETACITLVANSRPGVESFIIPGVNIMITAILLLGALKFFYSNVLYKYRLTYLNLNDAEAPALQELRERDKQGYMECVHIAHFSEKIAEQTGMDVEAIRTLAYYRLVPGEQLSEMEIQGQLPPMVVTLLAEYQGQQPILHKETTVLLMTEMMVRCAVKLVAEGKKEEFIASIDRIMDALLKDKRFAASQLSLMEFNKMKSYFKEERLYYDFLH